MRRLAVLLLAACSSGSTSVPDAGSVSDAASDSVSVSDSASDSGSVSDAGPICTRAAQAKTAPASLYDGLVADLGNLQSAQIAARVDQFIADAKSQGGTPLEDAADRLVFVVRGAPPQGPWSVAGTFTGWKSNPRPMTLVPGTTDLYVLDAHVARGVAHQYKLLSGTDDSGFTEDLLARNVVWDGIDHKTTGFFNAIAHASDGDASKGRIVRHHTVHANKLGDDRDVFVYLPPKYDDGSCTPVPQIVFHDGNESLTRGDFASVADATYASKPTSQAALVFVALSSQNVRTNEYTFGTQGALGDDYGEFLVSDLEPMITKAYRVCSKAGSRGISGASLGGLISTYLAFQRSDVWGFVGAQSASYFWDNDAMITRAGQDPVVPVRFYLDTGCPDGADNCTVVKQVRDALQAKSYDVTYVEDDTAQHDWPYWAARLPKLLADFPNGASCD
jgi:enterochelin esterase family protein